ncbi:MAG: type II secretion system protein [Spirochaetota bacterium]
MKFFNFSIFQSFNRKGFTIIELLVAMGIFSVLISIVSGGFISSLRTQRELTELISINDSANLTLEQIMRELRTGYNFSKISENELEFVNAKNKIIYYKFIDGAVERGESDAFIVKTYKKITADNVKIKNFNIKLMGNDAGDGYQSRITIAISIVGTSEYLQNVPVNVQMTVSSRVLDS